jgi:hypothetical protein
MLRVLRSVSRDFCVLQHCRQGEPAWAAGRRMVGQHQRKVLQAPEEMIALQLRLRELAHNLALAPSHALMSKQRMQWRQVHMELQIWQMTPWMKSISSVRP